MSKNKISKPNLYLANCIGFFSNEIVDKIVDQLSPKYDVFNPFEIAKTKKIENPKRIFDLNMAALDKADILLAILDHNGITIDEGIAWEMVE